MGGGGCSVHQEDTITTSSTSGGGGGGCSVHQGFQYKLKGFVTLLPTCIMISRWCTGQSPNVLMISPDVLMVFPWRTKHSPMHAGYPLMYSWYLPNVLNTPQCSKHSLPPPPPPDVLNKHYPGGWGSMPWNFRGGESRKDVKQHPCIQLLCVSFWNLCDSTECFCPAKKELTYLAFLTCRTHVTSFECLRHVHISSVYN